MLQLCGSRGPLRMTHPENNGPAGVREVGQVLPRALIYSRPVVLAVLHSLQPLEKTPASNLQWGGVGASWGCRRPWARRGVAVALQDGGTSWPDRSGAPQRAPRRGWASVPAPTALLDALLVLGCGPLARGGAVGRPGGGATSPRAAGSARRTSYEPAEVRRHLSLPKPVRSLPFTPALAAVTRRSLAAVHSPPLTRRRSPLPGCPGRRSASRRG